MLACILLEGTVFWAVQDVPSYSSVFAVGVKGEGDVVDPPKINAAVWVPQPVKYILAVLQSFCSDQELPLYSSVLPTIVLDVDVAVRSLLTEEGYDPIYGARPLRRAVMRLLEDTLAQQCLSKTLYPGTKLRVTRSKNGNSELDYTNDVEVEIDYSSVDPKLIDPNYGESKQSLRKRLENI